MRNFKEKEMEKGEIKKYPIESDSSYDETIKNLECTFFGTFIKSQNDVVQEMVSDVKFTIPKVNNSEEIRISFKAPRNTSYKNAMLD